MVEIGKIDCIVANRISAARFQAIFFDCSNEFSAINTFFLSQAIQFFEFLGGHYAISASADVRIGVVHIDKAVVDPQPRYSIGETVDYAVTVSVPPRSLFVPARLIDQLDAGFNYAVGSLQLNLDPQLQSALSPTDFTVGGGNLDLDLGRLHNQSDDQFQNLRLRYQVQVANVLSNQDGQIVGNHLRFHYGDPGTGNVLMLADDDNDIVVGEPRLTLDSSVVSTVTHLDGGDSITYELVIGNTGTTQAFDVVLSELLPVGLTDPSQLQVISTSSGAASPTFSTSSTGWTNDPFDLPAGGEIVIRYDALIDHTVLPGQELQTQTLATYASARMLVDGERDGSDSAMQDDDSVLNNYNLSHLTPTVTVDSEIALDLTLQPSGTDATFAIGETVTYQVTVHLIEGRLDQVIVTDTLPPGLVFENATVAVGNTGVSLPTLVPLVDGQTVTMDLGSVSNLPNGVSGDDFFTIDLTAVVTNIAENVAGTELGNTVSVDYIGADGPGALTFDADAQTPGTQPLLIEIVEPLLSMSKTAASEVIETGGVLNYSLTISHETESRSDAFDLVVVDQLPDGFSFVEDSASVPVEIDAQTLVFAVDHLPLAAQSIVIDYQVRADADTLDGEVKSNIAVVRYCSILGGDGTLLGGRTGNDGAGGLNDYRTSAQTQVEVIDLNGAIGDTVFYDINRNGVADPGEGVAGIAVVLMGRDGMVVRTVTGDGGQYSFTELRPGEYVVDVEVAGTVLEGLVQLVDPDGGADHRSMLHLAQGMQNHDQDFGYEPASSYVFSNVFVDRDGDGIMDDGEGIAGISVILTAADGAQQTALTDANGQTEFENLIGGDYQIEVGVGSIPLQGLVNTVDPDGGADNSAVLTLDGTSGFDDISFGYVVLNLNGPPHGAKDYIEIGLPFLEWRLVWINADSDRAMPLRMVDPLPSNMMFVEGSLVCSARGESSVDRCDYDPVAGEVVFEGVVGADPGIDDPALASNEVIVLFRAEIRDMSLEVVNQAFAAYDRDGDGRIGEFELEDVVGTDDGRTTDRRDATRWSPQTVSVPTMTGWFMLLLVVLLAAVGIALGNRPLQGHPWGR